MIQNPVMVNDNRIITMEKTPLTDDEWSSLSKLVQKGKTQECRIKYVQILLKLDEIHGNKE